jgi:hypothetical protein
MKRLSTCIMIGLLVILVQACIMSSTPSSPVSVSAGDSITFKVTVFPSNITVQWYVDANLVSGATGKSFIYSPDEGDVGTHTVMVKETSGWISLKSHSWEVEVISDPRLVAYYPFNGNANDESGNGNNGTVYGATLTADRFGNPNSAYSFDGISNYIKASSTNLPTAERTVSLWFKANTISNKPGLLGYGGNACGTSWFFAFNFTYYYNGAHCAVNSIVYNVPSEPISDWYHWVVTTDSSGTKMYVNGILVASNTTFVNNTYVNERDLGIGVISSPSGYVPYTDYNVGYFNGILDEIRIYNRALSSDEVNALYNLR